MITVDWEAGTVSDTDVVGCAPFEPLVLTPRQEAEYAAIGVPSERRPLLVAQSSACPFAKIGAYVVDSLGRWCIVVRS